MSKPCECCHTKMKFIWQMNGNFKHSMIIPDRFLSHFAAKSSGTITLETPNENSPFWMGGENDFLSFRYRGSSRFAVTVFDASGLEKVYFCCAAAGMKNASNNVQKKARTYIDISSSSDDHTTQSSASDTSDECQKARSIHHGKQAKKPSVSSSEDLSAKDGSSGYRSLESENLDRFSSLYYLPGHHKLTEEQKVELVALVDKIQPEICVLVIIMNKTNVKRHPDLVVPKDYALLHFPHKNQIITLELPGKKNWACKFRIRADGGGRHLYLGDFVHNNHILEGDLCIFQPMTKHNASVFSITVHLIRKERTDIASSHQTRRINSGGISSSSHDDTTRYNQGDKRFARRDSSSHIRKITKMAHEESGEGSPDENDSFKSDDLQTLPITDYVLSYKSYLSGAQTEQVIMLLREIRPKKPVLVAVMRKKNVQWSSPFLEIPKEYAAAHFPNESVAITLQMLGKNKKWHPRLCMENDKRIYMLRGHWLDFVLDNHVMEGDICLFEPMKGGKIFVFTVHLLCATPTDRSGGISVQMASSSHGRTNPKMASGVRIKEEPTDGNGSSENKKHGASNESLQNRNSNDSPYILPHRSHLSPFQEKDVLEKIEAIQYEVPICVAIMKDYNVDYSSRKYCMLELSSRYVARHFPGTSQDVVLHCMGNTWETKMIVSGNLTRWFLTGGWTKFACDNRLRAGDICLFELKEERRLTMAVHIIFSKQ
uniref:TF-B3 domain-containing protein n=1 Tax=Oryza punctata TaxID=4537 RepID=A0A0E0LTT0_ORYPU